MFQPPSFNSEGTQKKKKVKRTNKKQKGRENASNKLRINNRKNYTYPLKLPLYLQWHLQKILTEGQLKGVDKITPHTVIF